MTQNSEPPATFSRRTLLAVSSAGALAFGLPSAQAFATDSRFDLQAHRGGLGLTVESTIGGFEKAMRLGVTTLELDIQITADHQAVVTHDRLISPRKNRDTAPSVPGDVQWPYVGRFIKELTLSQIRTLDIGSLQHQDYPEQELLPGARMPLLSELFAAADRYGADQIRYNIETKFEAGAPEQTAPREQFIQIVAAEIRAANKSEHVTIQSFDWGALMRMREVAPELALVALDNEDFLAKGKPGKSPWLGGIDIDDYDGDPVAAIASFGADAWSPVQGRPQNGKLSDPDFEPYVKPADVERAHQAGLLVIPWTVNDPDTMRYFIDAGVDGLITDRPDLLRDVLRAQGQALPVSYPPPKRLVPLAKAHAHNDYLHERPLLDAMDKGFASVEADVWLQDGELRVAHEENATVPGRTLTSLYLQPLADRYRGGGRYHRYDGVFQLLVDIKSDGPSTYAAISAELRKFPRLVSRFAPRYQRRAVDVVISGNRPLDDMQAEQYRWAGYDGRLGDLDSGLTPEVMPLVSDNWLTNFTWTGAGPMLPVEQRKLVDIVAAAHAGGYRLRFWNTPDGEGLARTTLWSVLLDCGVDYLNTDDLAGLAAFLRARLGGVSE